MKTRNRAKGHLIWNLIESDFEGFKTEVEDKLRNNELSDAIKMELELFATISDAVSKQIGL